MNLLKQYKKLQQINVKAELCTTRKEAQKLIKKANKTQIKLSVNKLWTNTQETTGKK